MKFEHEAREEDNQTATFNKIPNHAYSNLDTTLGPISEFPELEQIPHSNSITLPQPLIHNQQHNKTHQFEPTHSQNTNFTQKQYSWNDPNLTFHPTLQTHLLYDDKSLNNLKQQPVKLKEQLRGLNEIVSEMLDKKYELVNQYESVVKQKKCYKRLMKNLEDEYEGYQTMLQANYHIKLQQEIQASTKQHNQLKKEVHDLNCQLSKPLIKNMQQSDMKLQKLQKQVFQTQMFIQKQKAAAVKKKQQLAQLMAKVKQKQASIKKLNKKINECQQLCEEEELMPQQNYKLLLEKFEQTKIKLVRLGKINELSHKKKDYQYQRKAKELAEKDSLLENINKEIINFSQKIRTSEIELEQAIMLRNSNAGKQQQMSKTNKKIQSRYYRANTPQNHQLQKIKKLTQHSTPFISLQRREKDYTAINSKAHRTLTEADDNQSRQELSLRKKRIYTQLEKNMYFKKIQHSEVQKLSRILQSSDLQQSPLQKENSVKKGLKLPKLYNAKLVEQAISPNNDSIIQQAKFSEVQEQRSKKKKSIEMHNKYIKQLKANRQALNRSNYQELCNILNRDRLLIEQECEYQISDLIYNSRF